MRYKRYRGGRYQGARYRGKRRPSFFWYLAGVLGLILVSIIVVSALSRRWAEHREPSSVSDPGQGAVEPVKPPPDTGDRSEQQEPDPLPEPEPEVVVENTGSFELPLEGTHGIAMVDLKVYEGDASSAQVSARMAAGTAFTILGEGESRVLARLADGSRGWLAKDSIMVNLPDLIPSILYKDSNAETSLMKNLGQDLDGITDQKLYEAKAYNEKLGQEQYIMPVQYHMAKKIMNAQQIAKEQDLTIVLYEGFRPYDVQIAIADALRQLAKTNADTRASIQKNGFNIAYYINTGISSHQMGSAVDVSLARVDRWETRSFHGNAVLVPGEFSEFSYSEIQPDHPDGVQFSSDLRYGPGLPEDTSFWMPTPIHELSYLSGTFTSPTKTYTAGAWRSALENRTVRRAEFWTDGAQTLQDIFVAADMEPLASEWWHFNDLEAWNIARKANASGKFEVGTQSFSMAPADAVQLRGTEAAP